MKMIFDKSRISCASAISLLAVLILVLLGWDALLYTLKQWSVREEYSHGYLIPFIALYLVYINKEKLLTESVATSMMGVLVVAVAVIIMLLGELSSLFILIEYAFVLALAGIVVSAYGWRIFTVLAVPVLYLLFMFPLPVFVLNNLSEKLQLISSSLGVAFIRACDISVFLEGNVIDLGIYKLQVAEACSGLNYLFPLMSLAFLCAYLFKGSFWQKSIIFLSSIPITIAMNSFRVGVIGVMVEYWGIAMAEGFLHAFEGWAVFMLSMILILAEIWLFARFSRTGKRIGEVLSFQPEAVCTIKKEPRVENVSLWPPLSSLTVVLIAFMLSLMMGARVEQVPQRSEFSRFPMNFDGWHGRSEKLPLEVIDVLKFDDYLIANYVHSDGWPVNFYAAWYDSQSKGQSAHSPSSCIPGGGWTIENISVRSVPGVMVAAQPLRVNRVDIRKGNQHQLVYYWFQQRGRIITNEYKVKGYLFLDGLLRNRTDGALVRLSTAMKSGEKLGDADKRLIRFARDISVKLSPYIPD